MAYMVNDYLFPVETFAERLFRVKGFHFIIFRQFEFNFPSVLDLDNGNIYREKENIKKVRQLITSCFFYTVT